jgi:hypothetical protein
VNPPPPEHGIHGDVVITAADLVQHFSNLGERVAKLEASAGKVAWGWQAWAVIIPALVGLVAMVGFMARVDARQEEQGRLLIATVSRLDVHLEAPGHIGSMSKIESIQSDVQRLIRMHEKP